MKIVLIFIDNMTQVRGVGRRQKYFYQNKIKNISISLRQTCSGVLPKKRLDRVCINLTTSRNYKKEKYKMSLYNITI